MTYENQVKERQVACYNYQSQSQDEAEEEREVSMPEETKSFTLLDAQSVCAVHISYPSEELREYTIKSVAEFLPRVVIMPCGNKVSFLTTDDIPREDVPCPCGNQNHWLVKYQIGAL